MHEDLREGMTAFTASISAVHASQVEGTEAVKASVNAMFAKVPVQPCS